MKTVHFPACSDRPINICDRNRYEQSIENCRRYTKYSARWRWP
jgi:hypothetical protein